MANGQLKFPPNDIQDWHQVPVPATNFYHYTSLKDANLSRDKKIRDWLRKEATGPYYVKSHGTYMNGQWVNVYCFRESTDAMMFAMLWS